MRQVALWRGGIPCLRPEEVKKAGLRSVRKSVARFIQRRGYWPALKELSRALRAHPLATKWYVDQLVLLGELEKVQTAPYRNAEIRMTARGWKALSVQPIAPWNARPRKDMIAKITRRVQTRLAAEQQIALNP